MRRAVAAVILALGSFGATAAVGGQEAGGTGLIPAPADRAALAAALAADGAVTRAPGPPWRSYPQDIAERFFGWLEGKLKLVEPWLEPWVGGVSTVLVKVLLVLLGAVVLARLLLALGKPRRQRRAVGGTPAGVAEPIRRGAGGGPCASDWGARFERRLSSGDVPGALEALWWWLACRLLADGVESSWTSGELLVRAARPDLAGLVRRLDRMIYGSPAPAGMEVLRLRRDLDEALG